MSDRCYIRISIPDEQDLEFILRPYLKEWKRKVSRSDDDSDGDFYLCYEVGLDFNKVIPMPEGILKTKEYGNDDEPIRGARLRTLNKLMKQNLQLHGFEDWYGWSVKHWGTKWNCIPHGFEKGGAILSFSTAWNPPYPIIRQLAKLVDRPVRMRYLSEPGYPEFEGLFTAFPNGDSDHLRRDEGPAGKLTTTICKVVDCPVGVFNGQLDFDQEGEASK